MKFAVLVLLFVTVLSYDLFEDELDDVETSSVRVIERVPDTRRAPPGYSDRNSRPRVVYVNSEPRFRKEDQVEFAAGTDRHGVYRLSMSKGMLNSFENFLWLVASMIFGLLGIRGAQVLRRAHGLPPLYDGRPIVQNANPFL